MKKCLFALFTFFAISFAENPFDRVFVGLEGGEIYPWGNLQDALENSFYGQMHLRYNYFNALDGYVQFGYMYFKTVDNTVEISGVHQFNGRVGLLYAIPYTPGFKAGGGFSCIWARSDGGNSSLKLGGTLSDNESEFGLHALLDLPVMRYEKYNAGLNVYFEHIWTTPKPSDMLWIGIYIERRVR